MLLQLRERLPREYVQFPPNAVQLLKDAIYQGGYDVTMLLAAELLYQLMGRPDGGMQQLLHDPAERSMLLRMERSGTISAELLTCGCMLEITQAGTF